MTSFEKEVLEKFDEIISIIRIVSGIFVLTCGFIIAAILGIGL